MTNVRADHQSKTESNLESTEEFPWSESSNLTDFITSSVMSMTNPMTFPEMVSSSQMSSPCKVCGDKSSGKHYGQITCEGCKSFFKRSIRRKFDYTCRSNKQCKINMEQRNQCQFCRFFKCLQVGMRKDAVQTMRLSKSQSDKPIDQIPTMIKPKSNNVIDNNQWNVTICPDQNISVKDVLDSILKAENAAPIRQVDDFYNQSLHIIYSIANWSQKLIYTDKISVADNLLLMQNCWCQLFILNYSLCGLTTQLFCNNQSCTQSFLSVQSQFLALSRLPMDAVEYGCLKALVFFNPDTPLLFNSTLVDKAQEMIQLALENHVSNSSSSNSRFGRILLRIPLLQRITSKQILDIFFKNPDDSFEKSINELFHKLLSGCKSEAK